MQYLAWFAIAAVVWTLLLFAFQMIKEWRGML